MSNTAKDIIIPDPGVFRIIFLYVGQGDSTLLAIPNGGEHIYVLIDSHQDEEAGGIDIIALLKDLFEGDERGLDVFINTHPHEDHIGAVKRIHKDIGIGKLWHSGHKAGGEHKEEYEDLEYVIDKLGDENVFLLKGTKEDNKLNDEIIKLGDIDYNILAPAEYVQDEIEDEDPDVRYSRIHEQCGVIRFRYGREGKQVLITGDADHDAWKEHILNYHEERIPSFILSAAHHGSNSFFWKGDPGDKDPYMDHLEKIDPSYIIVSAPKRKESKHDHPHEKAMNLYRDKVGVDNLKHLGKKRECIIVDITDEGDIDLYPDDELVKKYSMGKEESTENEEKGSVGIITGLDKKTFGGLNGLVFKIP